MKTNTSDLVDKLAKEDVSIQKPFQYEERDITRICREYENFLACRKKESWPHTLPKKFMRQKYDAEDITYFCAKQKPTPYGAYDMEALAFVNALVHRSKEGIIVIHLNNLIDENARFLSRTKKCILPELHVYGNLAEASCDQIMCSNIHIHGNVGHSFASRLQGNIVVHGNAEHQAGKDMRGGTLLIEGTAGEGFGDDAQAGIFYAKKVSAPLFGIGAAKGVEFHIDQVGKAFYDKSYHRETNARIFVKGKEVFQ